MSTTRAATRNSKDKPIKTQQNTQNAKADGLASVNKNQPTAEQMRLATMISDKNEADPELKAKIVQVTELTGRKEDEALIALHDCDYDLNRAVERLLENEDDQGEWKDVGNKKKKSNANAKTNDSLANHKNDSKREKSKDRDVGERSESSSRGRRDKGPPRFQRAAAGRGKDSENRSDSNSRDRSFERGKGRGRGGSSGPGRGRGRGRGGSRFERERGGQNASTGKFEKGPQIDTWTNETAANAEKENIGAWGDMADEWTADEWTGSLEESKVFTPSVSTDASSKNMFSSMNDNDAKIFTAPAIENQVFMASSLANTSTSPKLYDTTNTFQHNNSLPAPSVIGQSSSLSNSLGSSSMGQNSIGQNAIGQGLSNLAHLLQQSSVKQQSELSNSSTTSQSQYMSQYAKEATESIKNAVGIGTSSSSSQQTSSQSAQGSRVAPGMASTAPGSAISGPPQGARVGQVPGGLGQSRPQVPSAKQQQQQQQQGQQPPQRSKLPPPSKIPASAVEMPGSMNFNLDVQFGFGTPSDPMGFSFGGNDAEVSSNNYTTTSMSTSSANPSMTNHLSQSSKDAPSTMSSVISATATAKQPMGGLDSLAQTSSQSPRSTVYQNANSNTPPKDYSQSAMAQNKISSPPDPIPFPTDRKSSPYGAQRPGQGPGSISSNKGSGAAQQLSYSQSGYAGSSYQSSSYNKPSLSQTSSGYNNSGSNSLTSGQGQYGAAYQSGSFQSQSGYHNNQGSLYQGSSNQTGSFQAGQGNSSYQGQSASYQNQGGSYERNQSGSYHSRDSTSGSGSSYSSSQANSAYPSATSQSSSSSYQRDTPASQSGYSGYSSGHQNSLQNSQMASSKLSDSLSNMTVKDSGLDGSSSKFDGATSSASLTTITTTTGSSVASGSINVASTLGLGSTTMTTVSASSLSNTGATKSAAPQSTTKAPPNLPPGVPLIGHNYMTIGQPGMPFAAFGLAAQQPMYSYEDLQLIPPRLPMPQQPPTTITGRDGQANLAASAPYTAAGGSGGDNKINRVDAQSPVNAQTSQQQAQPAHQQAFINPNLPPGYSFYYPAAGMMPAYNYPPSVYQDPMVLQVPSVTNAAHGGTTASGQFQKPGAYGSHAYGTGGQAQDFKAYGSVSQSANKVATAGGTVSTAGADMSAAGSGYGKTHTQGLDKGGFHAGTPPPFNLQLPTGTQAGPLGAPTAAYGAPYMPMMAQPHHYHAQLQDSTGGSSRGGQQSSVQQKTASAKSYGTTNYWGAN